MDPKPSRPDLSDRDALYDALPPHQDYRRALPAKPRVRSHGDPNPVLTGVLVVATFIVIGIAIWLGAFSADTGGPSTRPPRSSAASKCEQAWLDNKDNAYNVLRTKAEYMTNCKDMQRALDQIADDHR